MLEKIDEGTSATIYSGVRVDPEKEENVAIKLFKSRLEDTERSLIELIMKAPDRFGNMIKHYDCFMDKQTMQTCAVMEMAQGGSLYKVI